MVSLVYALDTVEIPLEEGWNLVSIPLDPEDPTLPTVLDSIDGSYNSVFTFDPFVVNEWDKWKSYVPDRPVNSLASLDRKYGFWINMSANDSLMVEGVIQETTIFELKEGWNLIGYPSVALHDAETVFSGVDGELEIVYTYDGEWKFYEPGNPSSTLSTMGPGYGYWVKVIPLLTAWFFDGERFNDPTLFADLVITDVSFSSSPEEGDSVDIVATIRNDGAQPAVDVNVTFWYQNNLSEWVYIGDETILFLIFDNETQVQVTFDSVPYYRQAQGVNIKVVADDMDINEELNEKDNVYFKNLHVRVPDLTLSGSEIRLEPRFPLRYDDINISVNISNIGEADAIDVNVSFWYTYQYNLTYIPHTYLDSVIIASLPSETLQTVTSPTLIENVQYGYYRAEVEVDSGGKINESIEVNNYGKSPRKLVPERHRVNLTLGYFFSPLEPYPRHPFPIEGDEINLSASVRNTFAFIYLYNVTVKFHHTPPGGSEYLLSRAIIPRILITDVEDTPSNESLRNVANGTHEIRAEAFNNGNRIDQTFINITVMEKRPDLTVVDFSIEPVAPYLSPIRTQDLTLTANISNVGRIDAMNLCTRFYINNGALTPISPCINIILNPLYSRIISYNWTVDTDGTYNLSVRVDPDNNITEESEENNNMTIADVFIRDTGPDFAISEEYFEVVSFPENPMVNQESRLVVYVYNMGDTPEYYYATFYEEVDGNLIELGSSRNKQISIGAMRADQIIWNATEPGVHKIVARLDPNNIVTESVEDNNNGSSLVRVKSRPFTIRPISSGGRCYLTRGKTDCEYVPSKNKTRAWCMADSQRGCGWKWKKFLGITYPWYDCDYSDKCQIRGVVYHSFKVEGPNSSNASMADINVYLKGGALFDSFVNPLGETYWHTEAKVGVMEGNFNTDHLPGLFGKDTAYVKKSETIVNVEKDNPIFTSAYWGGLVGGEVIDKISFKAAVSLAALIEVVDFITPDGALAGEGWHTIDDVPLEAGKVYTIYFYSDSVNTAVGLFSLSYSDWYFHNPHMNDVGGRYFKKRGLWLEEVEVYFKE